MRSKRQKSPTLWRARHALGSPPATCLSSMYSSVGVALSTSSHDTNIRLRGGARQQFHRQSIVVPSLWLRPCRSLYTEARSHLASWLERDGLWAPGSLVVRHARPYVLQPAGSDLEHHEVARKVRPEEARVFRVVVPLGPSVLWIGVHGRDAHHRRVA